MGRVFASITRTNTDGRLSIRDLRQWYITFGRHALAAAAAAGRDPESALSAPGGSDGAAGDGVVVSVPVMKSLHVHLATTATKSMVGGGGRRGSKDRAAAAAAKPLYPWEQGGAAAAASSASASAPPSPTGGGATPAARRQSAAAAPALQQQSQQPPQHPQPPAVQFPTLPNGLLEFQVRLTPSEYAAVGRLRRAMDAEERYKRRMGEAQARAAARRGIGGAPVGGLGGGFDGAGSVGGASEGVSALRTAEPYAEPLSRDAAALLSRGT